MKEEVIIRLVSKQSDLPDFHSRNFFHSKEMFCIMEHTPSLEPCMAIAEDGGISQDFGGADRKPSCYEY